MENKIKKDNNILIYESVRLDEAGNKLVILDQTRLPNETVFLYLDDLKEIWEAIYYLRVRGAPAIGIAAGMGIAVAAENFKTEEYEDFYNQFKRAKDYLASSRPTAVNLFWALNRMEQAVLQNKNKSIKEIKRVLKETAQEIKDEDIWVCRQIGEYGLELIKDGWGILTHCNAGQLATAKYGTALAPIYIGHERGYKLKVFTDETRPLLQGSRLSAYELHSAGIDTTLICDNMASIVMKNGWIQAVFVGCDRVAANGDSANKIGTSGVAVLAKHYGIPFYICAPTSTIDMECKSGKFIEIEQRPPKEVTEMWYSKPMAPEGIKVYNPAFDVTDANLITAIITEWGVAKPPYNESFKEIFLRKEKNRV